MIQEEARPKFGFFYDARSFYGIGGKYQNPGDFPEYMTCVGFSLTVIQSYLGKEEFLQYADRDHSSYDLSEVYLTNQILKLREEFPAVSLEDIKKNIR